MAWKGDDWTEDDWTGDDWYNGDYNPCVGSFFGGKSGKTGYAASSALDSQVLKSESERTRVYVARPLALLCSSMLLFIFA